jgi:mono/diheme cytochrome c family protein
MKGIPLLLLLPLLCGAQIPADHAARMAAGQAIFTQSLRAVLIDNCVDCHGGNKTRADLNMATREGLLAGGENGAAIIPDKPDESLLMRLIRHQKKPHMPSREPKLADSIIADFAKWIALGAPYDKPLIEQSGQVGEMQVTDSDREFWSFQPLGPGADTRIDAYVDATLVSHKISPNPLADRRSLVRRAYLDLLGLPPTPEQIDAFLADTAEEAWPRLIDSLLESPHYGERWARHWMDVARFAESTGFEHDYDRKTAYHYRDFLIKAFNADMPYDQFVRWQLAGDELAPDSGLAHMATGFLAAGVFPTQITEAEFEVSRYDELDDMVATTGVAFLGLSIGCARCHDHKYDPLPTRDYYRLAANFAKAIRNERNVPISGNLEQRMLEWNAKSAPLRKQVDEARKTLASAFVAKIAAPQEAIATSVWRMLRPSEHRSKAGATLTLQPDLSLLATGKNGGDDTYTLRYPVSGSIAALRIETLTHKSMPRNGPGRASNGNFGLSTITAQLGDTVLKLREPRATHQQNTSNLSIASTLDTNGASGWAVDVGGIGKDQAAAYSFDSITAAEGDSLVITMRFSTNTQHNIGRLRVSVSANSAAEIALGKGEDPLLVHLRDGSTNQLSENQLDGLRDHLFAADKAWTAPRQAWTAHLAAKPVPETAKVLVCTEGLKPLGHHANGRGYPHFYPEVHLLLRGDVAQKREVTPPGFIQVLTRGEGDWETKPPAGSTSSFHRASLARWLTDAEHGAGHLAARVIVNRLWHHHFGRGLVSTPNDFGFQGDAPTHPALLDRLAADLIAGGWRLKPLHKRLMLSAAYRRSSVHNADSAKADIDNRYLWRFKARRLEGEAIRDSMLAVAGLLDRKQFGPGTLDANASRRSVYFTVKRSKLIPDMLIFDWPEHLVSIGSRARTTIAPQALMAMNSPIARRCADALAKNSFGDDRDHAIRAAHLQALGRAPNAAEFAAANSFLDAQVATRNAAVAFADYCHVLLCSNEFVYLP